MNRVMFSSKTSKWATPQWLFDLLDAEFHFDCDVCATAVDTKVPGFYFTPELDGLKQQWRGTVFMNPPYDESRQWVEKAYKSSLAGATVVGLLVARTGTKYWHRYVTRAYEIRFVVGRLKFGDATNSAPFDSAIVIWKPGKHKEPITSWVELAEVQRSLCGC